MPLIITAICFICISIFNTTVRVSEVHPRIHGYSRVWESLFSVRSELRLTKFEYRVQNAIWQHACGWNKLLVYSENKRKTEERSQEVEREYDGSLSHHGHLDINGKLFHLLRVLVSISFLPLTNLHITFFKNNMIFCRLVNKLILKFYIEKKHLRWI